MTFSTGLTIGHYHITDRLGVGGMGEVWLAEDTKLGREVALKVLPDDVASDPDRCARFDREAKVLASLNHPNIAHLYGLESASATGTDELTTFLVMELVQGEDLSERVSRGPVPVNEAIPMALQIAEALEAAHEQGIVHRDLKPANIKLRPDGAVKVLDFGLAKAWDGEGGDQSLSMSPTLTAHATAAGVILGTAAYMAPEQAAGVAADQRADIWAFGVVLWEMLTGQKLFEGETVSHVLASVLKDVPDLDALPSDTPPRLRDLIEHCLRKKPRRRLQSIGDARVMLEDYLADPSAFQAIASGAVETAPSRRIWPWALPLVLILLAAAIFAVTRSDPDSPAEPRVIRFDLAAPEGTTYHLEAANPGPIVLSPDGRSIAFSARDAVGKIHLYLRQFDTVEATVMTGADEAQYPFWSPDSTSIGFFADGKLKKIDAAGGPPITLCDAPNGKGGSWNSSGDIIFAPGPATPLMLVSESGGEPVELTKMDSDRGDNSHRHPRFLPDGRRFIYLARADGSAEQAGHAVVAASLDGGPETVVVRSTAAAEFAAGRLLFMRERTLMSRPFDPDTLEFTGAAVPVGPDVLAIPGAVVAIFSASSSDVLAYQPSGGGLGGFLTWFDRDGNQGATVGEQADYGEVWVSPDGSMALVSMEDQVAGTADIWLVEIERNVISRLTSDPGDEQQIIWSPDSKKIAFARRGGGTADIFVKEIGGAPAQLVLESELDTYPTSWSPDGRMIGFDSQSPETAWDQWILPLDSGEPIPFLQSQFNETNGVFSPDGRWMAFTSDESGRQEIYVTPFPGPGRRWRVSTEGGIFANWNSNGRELFFMSFTNQVMAVPVDLGDGTISIGAAKSLVEANISPMSYPYSPSPGGEKILAITQPLGPQSLRVVFDWTAELPDS